MNTPTVVITHHTGGTDANPLLDTSSHTVGIINEWHKTRWPNFISRRGYHAGYHFFIAKNGKVTQTRDLDEEGAHVIGMNNKSIGVCFAGNFDVTLPTAEQLKSWNELYKDLQSKYPNIPTYPHRKYATKTCHGRLLSDNFFATEYQKYSIRNQIDQLRAYLLSLATGRRFR